MTLANLLEIYLSGDANDTIAPFGEPFFCRLKVYIPFILNNPQVKVPTRSIFVDKLLGRLVVPCKKDNVSNEWASKNKQTT